MKPFKKNCSTGMENLDMMTKPSDSLLELTADVVAAYVSDNPVPVSELPGLIAGESMPLLGALAARLGKPCRQPVIGDDYIICLEDGKEVQVAQAPPDDPFRALARNCIAESGAWSPALSGNPITCGAFNLAKSMGLGRKRKKK